MKNFLEAFEYQITEGSQYQWNCYGHCARFLDFENELAYGSIIYDSKTQFIYQAEIWTKDSLESPYRYINEHFIQAHNEEAKSRNIDTKLAFDNVKFIDLDLQEDFIEKATAIWRGLPFDKRVKIPIEDELFYDLAKHAHEKDITVNALVEKILLEVIEREKIDSDIVVV